MNKKFIYRLIFFLSFITFLFIIFFTLFNFNKKTIDRSSKIVVFWNIAITSKKGFYFVPKQISTIKKSGIISKSFKFFYVIGDWFNTENSNYKKNYWNKKFNPNLIKKFDIFKKKLKRLKVPKFYQKVWKKNNRRKGVYEFPTLELLYNYCKKTKFWRNTYVLYFHSKGGSGKHDSDNWRDLMMYFNIEKYKMCFNALETKKWDSCGVFLIEKNLQFNCREANYTFYGGNFWWATCSHIRKLHNPRLTSLNDFSLEFIEHRWCKTPPEGRYLAEYWLGSSKFDNSKFKPLNCFCDEQRFFYGKVLGQNCMNLKRAKYWGKNCTGFNFTTGKFYQHQLTN